VKSKRKGYRRDAGVGIGFHPDLTGGETSFEGSNPRSANKAEISEEVRFDSLAFSDSVLP